jgi:hypothetical protein
MRKSPARLSGRRHREEGSRNKSNKLKEEK